MVTVTYPADPDVWGESLTPAEGRWIAGTGGTVALDIISKAVGLASIRHRDGADYIAYPFFELNDGAEFDGTKENAKLHFYHALDEYFEGVCRLVLVDNTGKQAWRDFGTAPNKTFQLKEFSLAGPWDNIDSGFDWTHIKRIGVWGYYSETSDSYCWIDWLHFSYEVELGTLRIESVPTGKTGEITLPDGTYPFTTPSEVSRIVGTEGVVSIDPVEFVRWDDDVMTPTRTIVFQLGVQIIKAIYEVAELVLLNVRSYDQNMKSFPAQQAVKVIYEGIEQYIDVPFATRVSKGQYAFVAESTSDREFDFWRLPDGSKSTEPYVLIDIQEDTVIQVHWIVAGVDGVIENYAWLFIPTSILLIGTGILFTK